jgi:hypothetical protein
MTENHLRQETVFQMTWDFEEVGEEFDLEFLEYIQKTTGLTDIERDTKYIEIKREIRKNAKVTDIVKFKEKLKKMLPVKLIFDLKKEKTEHSIMAFTEYTIHLNPFIQGAFDDRKFSKQLFQTEYPNKIAWFKDKENKNIFK